MLDTAGGKTSTSADIIFNGKFDNSINPISVTRTFSIGKRLDLGFYLDPTPQNGGDQNVVIFNIKEISGKSYTGLGIRQITFNLTYNTDLLTFNQTQSTNVISTDGKNFTVTGSPNLQADSSGVLASLAFTVFLTIDSSTTIFMNNMSDTTYLPTCGMMTTSSGGSATFNYNFICGERSISGFMKGILPLKIIGIRPNPAQDEISIDLQSAQDQEINIEIFNELGMQVFSKKINLTKEILPDHIDTKNLSSGLYLVRIGGESRSFMKVR